MAETTALGCAFAAGLAVGVWKDQQELLDVQHHAVSYAPFEPQVVIMMKNFALCSVL